MVATPQTTQEAMALVSRVASVQADAESALEAAQSLAARVQAQALALQTVRDVLDQAPVETGLVPRLTELAANLLEVSQQMEQHTAELASITGQLGTLTD